MAAFMRRARSATSWTLLAGLSVGCTLLNPLSGYSDGDARAVQDAGAERPAGSCPCSLFGDAFNGTPSYDDNHSVELGVRFTSDVPGTVTAIRYYRGPLNDGPHTGSIWLDANGDRIVTQTFTHETPTGWQTLTLDPAVAVEAGVSYVVSYHAPVGHYAATAFSFSHGWDAPPLHLVGTSGLFSYGATQMPEDSFNGTNYWVDVIFEPE